MDNDKLKYYNKLIFRKRKKILNTDNFTNWFTNNNSGIPNECGDLRGNTNCLNGKNQSKYDETNIHSKAKILQYLRQLDDALILIRNGNYGICINCNEEISKNHLEKLPNTRHCLRCE